MYIEAFRINVTCHIVFDYVALWFSEFFSDEWPADPGSRLFIIPSFKIVLCRLQVTWSSDTDISPSTTTRQNGGCRRKVRRFLVTFRNRRSQGVNESRC